MARLLWGRLMVLLGFVPNKSVSTLPDPAIRYRCPPPGLVPVTSSGPYVEVQTCHTFGHEPHPTRHLRLRHPLEASTSNSDLYWGDFRTIFPTLAILHVPTSLWSDEQKAFVSPRG